ncbi:molybdenum cofactor synthesis domain protein [Methanosalsum zhilinae DSM 4017]|uniref:Molybdenum cofactor synthesis domain protein n=1 Tax=Methanosalsum zhilinae (strain DSM 4017 / NBRC 107636 / OCM 62 / WeN5) TaxID=679901 RepID=F7XMD3_METZD|nr:gephyrin-like molybdotransferase Glp [Methanosalsum zhilinae]AEH61669.1 molybdenum cofactor synthesis domain protein [Methanosalsum zhilinae DSM 4017]
MKSKIIRKRTKLADARELLLNSFTPPDSCETIELNDSCGRVLAKDVIAERNVPHYDRAAMDGYAVRSSDTVSASDSSPIILRATDEISEGSCVRVHTGSAMPPESDAVVKIEDTSHKGDLIEVHTQVHPGKHVGYTGEDIKIGDKVLDAGHFLRPCDIAMLASIGINIIEVYRKPVVAIIPTGNELVKRPSQITPPPGKITETNSLMAGMYVSKWGGKPQYCDIVPDNPELIGQVIESQLNADMILLCGGTSVGERDHVPDAVDSIGKILVHGIGISPGKPTALGVINNIPVICMPGYPAAGLVCLFEFVRPSLMKLAHINKIRTPPLQARLDRKITSRIGYVTYTRVRLENGNAIPLMTSGAGIMSSVSRADGFVVIEENVEGYEEGEIVEVELIE